MGNHIFKPPSSKQTTVGAAAASQASSMSPSDYKLRLEPFTLIWIAADGDNDQRNESFEKRLREVDPCLLTFNDPTQCERWLTSPLNEQKQVFLIVEGNSAKRALADIDRFKVNLVSIYVYPAHTEACIERIMDNPKLRINTSQVDQLFEILLKDRNHLENIQSAKSFIIFKDPTHGAILSTCDNSFLLFKLIVEMLTSTLYLPSPPSHKQAVDVLRESNSNDKDSLDFINEFEQTYDGQNAIDHLINNTPLAPFVNQALREQNIPILFYFRFFLFDVYQQLGKQEQQSSSIVVYRKQLIPKNRLVNMAKGNYFYLMFNEFLLTSKKQIDLESIEKNDDGYVTVIMKITATNDDPNVVFGCKKDSTDVVFMCGAILKIKSFSQHSDYIFQAEFTLEQNTKFRSLSDQLNRLRQTKNILIIGDSFEKYKQSDKANLYYQCLLENLPQHHELVVRTRDKLIMNAKIQPVSLTSTKVFVVDLLKNLCPLSTSMFDALQQLTNDTIEICDNYSNINFDEVKHKTLIILTNNQVYKSITQRPQQITKYLVLEEKDQDLTDREKYFNTGKNLIFELAGELYTAYAWESRKDLRDADHQSAEQKQLVANRISIEFKKVYRQHSSDIEVKVVDPPVQIIWLKYNENENPMIEKIKDFLKTIITNLFVFDNPGDCFVHLSTNDDQRLVYLIIDDEYSDTEIATIQHDKLIRKMFRYKQSTPNGPANPLIQNFVILSIIHDIIKHFYQLSDHYEQRGDQNNQQRTLANASHLANLLKIPKNK